MSGTPSSLHWSLLAENLSWLEAHCRQQVETASDAHALRLASSLVRNVIGPEFEGPRDRPKHVAVIGGAGSGKSTIANFLMGTVAAEANPQAGFTRHPVAYMDGRSQWQLPQTPGFLAALRLLTHPAPSSLDEDVYQVRYVSGDEMSLLRECIVWDCPDMTTWAATGYVPRLMEICGLADLLVYVASDERYNDEIPTRFLSLLLETGKTVVVVLTKMREAEVALILEHFREEVGRKMPRPPTTVLAIPHLTAEQLADPIHRTGNHRWNLVHTIRNLLNDPGTSRRRHAENAVEFLRLHQEKLLSVAKMDLIALERWSAVVREGQAIFEGRYQREYLNAERFPRFDEAMVRLIDLMELPGVGRFISGALYVVRTPYRWLKSMLQKSLSRQATIAVPERPIMEAALDDWLHQLGVEARRRSGTHPIWGQLCQSFETSMLPQVRDIFERLFRDFQLAIAEDVEKTSRAIYAELEKDPTRLNVIRGGKLALDVISIGAVLMAGGINIWDVALVPLAASVSQMIAETLGWQYVESQREAIRQRQGQLARQMILEPLSQWLQAWPAKSDSTYATLQQLIVQVPEQIEELHRSLRKANAA